MSFLCADTTTSSEVTPQEDPSLPEDWKAARLCAHSTSCDKVFLFQSSGISVTYPSRLEAVRAMLGNRSLHSPANIEMMRRGLMTDGWRKSEGLPDGWMARDRSVRVEDWGRTVNVFAFLAPDLRLFSSVEEALRELITCELYTSESVFSKFVLHFCLMAGKALVKSFQWFEVAYNMRLGNFTLENGTEEKIILTGEGLLYRNCGDFLESVKKTTKFSEEEKEEISELISRYLDFEPVVEQVGEKVTDKPKSKKKTSKKVLEDWSDDDDTLPRSWKFKINNRITKDGSKRKTFLAPDGSIFSTRLQAVEYLVEKKASQDDISGMVGGLVEERWIRSEKLPEDWLHTPKTENRGRGWFISSKGHLMKNYQDAYQYLVANNYSTNYINSLQTMYKMRRGAFVPSLVPTGSMGNTTENTGTDEEGDEIEKNLPPGWKSTNKTCEIKYRKLVSPDGKVLHGFIEALRHMTFSLQPPAPKEDIGRMKQILVDFDGWTTNPRIPIGWLTKKLESNFHIHYLTTDLKRLRGVVEASEHLKNNDFSHEDISNFEMFVNDTFAKPPIKIKPVFTEVPSLVSTIKVEEFNTNDTVTLEEESEVCTETNETAGVGDTDISDESNITTQKVKTEEVESTVVEKKSPMDIETKILPPGWKFLEKHVDRHRTMSFSVYMSPEGVVHKTLLKALASLTPGLKDFELLKTNLGLEGWMRDGQNLPPDWLYKKTDNRIIYLSPNLDTVRGYRNMVQHLQDNQYSSHYLEKLIFCGKKRKRSGQSRDSPTDIVESDHSDSLEVKTENEETDVDSGPANCEGGEEDLPTGWKLTGGRLSSPEGVLFNSRLEAVVAQMESGQDPAGMYSLWSTLYKEGWELDPSGLLPMGWRVKGDKYLARELVVLQGEAEAEKFLGRTEDYSQKDRDYFRVWRQKMEDVGGPCKRKRKYD